MTDERAVWGRPAARAAAHAPVDLTVIHYGVDLPTDAELRLLPPLTDRRVLDLGCGPGHNSVAAARRGAHVIGVDLAPEMLDEARALASANGVRVEWRAGDLAELAWLRADSVDVALAIGVLEHVEDLDRALRQIHRVLRTGGVLVMSHPHPLALCATREHAGDGSLALGRLEIRRSYFDPSPISVGHDGDQLTVYPRPVSVILAALARAGYAIDALHEPEPIGGELEPELPTALIVRASKLGS